MTAIVVPSAIRPLTQVAKYIRNGKIVDATLQTENLTLANQAAALRGKEVFRSSGAIQSMPSTGGSTISPTPRWRFQFRTGPFTKSIGVRAIMVRALAANAGGSGPAVSLNLSSLAGAALGADQYHWSSELTSGSIPAIDVPDNMAVAPLRIAATPNTDYAGVFADFMDARTLSIVVFEELLTPDTANGFVSPSSVSIGGPIGQDDRGRPENVLFGIHLNAAHTFNWSTDNDSEVRVATGVAADKNVIDNSTAVSAATPGFTLDMTGKARVSQTGLVNMVVAAFGESTGVAGIHIKNAAGTVVGAVTTGFGTAGSPKWTKKAFTLPVGVGKYDVQYFSTSGTFKVYAVSVYEQG